MIFDVLYARAVLRCFLKPIMAVALQRMLESEEELIKPFVEALKTLVKKKESLRLLKSMLSNQLTVFGFNLNSGINTGCGS